MMHLVTLGLTSVFCENIPEKIAGIGLRDGLSYLCGHFYLGICCLGAGCILCLAEETASVRWVPSAKTGSSHLISLSSKTNYKKN